MLNNDNTNMTTSLDVLFFSSVLLEAWAVVKRPWEKLN